MNPKKNVGMPTVFLLFVILGNAFVIFSSLSAFSSFRGQLDGGLSMILFVLFALQVGIFVSVIGLWNWKEWGYKGVMAGYVLGGVANFLVGSISTGIGSIIGMCILYYLMNDKKHLLE